ncbi:MAG TPA: aspartyl-phosphate phosphatase Spo0E family protein [Firmicutes bacterium]|nr:aspartyl-phosphate phosphatase Spo0E family protein [Bacillota bacterium]HOQ24787.1 aspartyl-phosphate phosphatase Spo0E family protein [Bacillota bacterium]HPT68019.1 aspartyl-phosphate phosphatase Spo0E family protein [Bacillota bacterium]
MRDLEEISQEIEQLRRKLQELAEQANFQLNHPEIVQKSRELDRILNDYMRLLKEKK